MDTPRDDLRHVSRVDEEIALATLKAESARYYALLRPHGRWRKDIPPAVRIPPRTLHQAHANFHTILEQLYDWLHEDAARPS